MSDLSVLALTIAILLFIIGSIIFIIYFPWRKPRPLYMKIVFDSKDYYSFDAVTRVLFSHDLIAAKYEEKEDVSIIIIGAPKKVYQTVYNSIRALPNVEVI